MKLLTVVQGGEVLFDGAEDGKCGEVVVLKITIDNLIVANISWGNLISTISRFGEVK